MSIQSSGRSNRFRNEIRTAIGWFCCLFAVALLLAQGTATAADKFKPFKLKTVDGTKKTLEDYANKVTLVSFFFPKCEFCKVSLPEVQKIYDKYKDKGLSVVWINVLPEQNKLIAGWQAENHFTIPVLIGASQDALQRDYRLIATPTHYLVGQNGDILLYQSGYKAGDEKALDAKIVEALKIAP